MCGKDEAQREVYKLKEEPETGDREKRRKEEDEETERNKREESKKEKWYYWQNKDICESDLVFETGLREILEANAIVNLVLYTHALKIVLSGPFTWEPNTVRFVTKLCPYKNHNIVSSN